MTTRAARATLALAALCALTGCVAQPDTASPAPAAAESAPPQPQRNDTQTLWTIEGSKTSLPDDDPDVIALQRTVALHSATVDNRSANTVETAMDQEFSFYTVDFVAKLDAEDYRDATIALYRDNDLTTEQLGVAWSRSTVSEDRTRATVGFESILQFATGDEEYLQARGLLRDERYAQARELTLIKIDDTWTIDDIRKAALTKSAALNE